jgi:L-fucose isomerase-like protein
MNKRIAIFWPGDYRDEPNRLALSGVEEATAQMEKALAKLGFESYRIEGFVTKPNEAIEKLSGVDDPIVGMYTHWVYGPHTTDGVVGKDNPLLLASNFDGTWPGLVGLLNTSACLEYVNRKHSRIWTDAEDWTEDRFFMDSLSQWCKTGDIVYPETGISTSFTPSANATAAATNVFNEIERKRIIALMLGDTSMGMINGYFGTRFLNKIGFTEHKVDQAWIIARGKHIDQKRIDEAYDFVCSKGIIFHYGEAGAEDFDENSTKEQLRDYLVVLDLVKEFKADCVGWQYQLGLIESRPPSDFAEGLLNSACRPESNGSVISTSTEGDQGNLVPMELMKRLLSEKGLHPSTNFHDLRWGVDIDGDFIWVLNNSGSAAGYSFNHDPDSLKEIHSYRQPAGYFPFAGGTFTGASKPGAVTWSRAFIKDDELWMDIGKGEVVEISEEKQEELWSSVTREWPFMAINLGVSRDTIMAHYMSNHAAVAYGDIFEEMIALSQKLGFKVRIFG